MTSATQVADAVELMNRLAKAERLLEKARRLLAAVVLDDDDFFHGEDCPRDDTCECLANTALGEVLKGWTPPAEPELEWGAWSEDWFKEE